MKNGRPTQGNTLSLSCWHAQRSVCIFVLFSLLVLDNSLIAKQPVTWSHPPVITQKSLDQFKEALVRTGVCGQSVGLNFFFSSAFFPPAPGCISVAWQPIYHDSWCQLIFISTWPRKVFKEGIWVCRMLGQAPVCVTKSVVTLHTNWLRQVNVNVSATGD